MPSVFGPDMSPVVKFALILTIVLFLVGMFIVILRKLTGGKLIPSSAERNRSRQPRLGVVDIYDLDRTRQLVLLRRDNVEHLLLIGGLNDVVIETNIVRVTTGRTNLSTDIPFERQDPALESASRPSYEASLRPVVEAGNFRHDIAEEPLLERQAQPAEPFFEIPVSANRNPAFTNPQDLSPQQAAVAAASLAAVAVATQYVPQFETNVEETVPDFLKGEKKNYQTDQDFDAHAQLLGSQQKQDDIARFKTEQELSQPIDAFSNIPPIADNFVSQPSLQHTGFEEPPVLAPSHSWATQQIDAAAIPSTAAGIALEHDQFVDAPNQLEAVSITPEAPEAIYPDMGVDRDEQPYTEYEEHTELSIQVGPVFEEAPVAQEETQPISLDDATLSDMARQLEEALKTADLSRSFHVSEPEPTESEIPTVVSPPPYVPEVTNSISGAFGYQVIDRRQVSETLETNPEPAPQSSTTEAVESFEEPNVEVQQNTPNLQQEKAVVSHDPFSLDDIEAEFARLLGRGDSSNS